jgi:hypothetical protein
MQGWRAMMTWLEVPMQEAARQATAAQPLEQQGHDVANAHEGRLGKQQEVRA